MGPPEPHTTKAAHEEFWNGHARDLAALFSLMPNFNPYNLGENPQEALAAYAPPSGLWTEKDEKRRAYFVEMERRMFLTVYQTFRAGTFHKGFLFATGGEAWSETRFTGAAGLPKLLRCV